MWWKIKKNHHIHKSSQLLLPPIAAIILCSTTKPPCIELCTVPEIFQTRLWKLRNIFFASKNDFFSQQCRGGFQLCSGEHLSNNGMKQGIKGRELRGAHTAQHYTQFWPDKIFAFPMSSTAQSRNTFNYILLCNKAINIKKIRMCVREKDLNTPQENGLDIQ